MKTLAIRQPFAALIADGWKSIEVRRWKTNHRGRMLIVASGKPMQLPDRDGALVDLPTQVQVCIVDLLDVRPMTAADAEAACCNYEPGAYAWLLAHVADVRPSPHKGRLSLYETPDAGIVRLPPKQSWLDPQ